MRTEHEVQVSVTFGPAATPTLACAIAFATEHADEVRQLEQGAWRASFRLGAEEARFGRLLQLVNLVGGWRTTLVEVDGSPERLGVLRQMLTCARGWLRIAGACRQAFVFGRPWPKCLICPLYEPEWALESWAGPSIRGIRLADPDEAGEFEVPDYPPEDYH